MKCDICGSNLKDPKSKKHIESAKHQNALNGGGTSKTVEQKFTSKGVDNQKIAMLENQMKFVLDKVNQLEQRILSLTSNGGTKPSTFDLNRRVMSLIPNQGSITIDDITKALKEFDWYSIENSLKELLEDQKIDVAEGRSNNTLYGKYGRIIRR